MTSTPFDELPMHDKKVLVNDFATQLCSIEFYDHRIFLYALGPFFIEAYRNIDTQEVETIRVARYKDLDKFLTRVRLQLSYHREKNN
jgi:hypothetical protein